MAGVRVCAGNSPAGPAGSGRTWPAGAPAGTGAAAQGETPGQPGRPGAPDRVDSSVDLLPGTGCSAGTAPQCRGLPGCSCGLRVARRSAAPLPTVNI